MEPKAILLIDNCRAHLPVESLQSDDGKIIAMLLPPNVTAVIQPMDQNPIRIVKLKYRNQFLSKIVAEEDVSIELLLKNHNIRDAILMLKSVWDELPASVLTKAWFKIDKWDENEYDDEDDLPLSELIASDDIYEETIEQTRRLLTEIAPNCHLNLEEINEWNDLASQEDEQDDESQPEDDETENSMDCESVNVQVSDNSAMTSVNNLIQWCEANKATKHIPSLCTIRTDIVEKYITKPKVQKSVTDYFESRSAA